MFTGVEFNTEWEQETFSALVSYHVYINITALQYSKQLTPARTIKTIDRLSC